MNFEKLKPYFKLTNNYELDNFEQISNVNGFKLPPLMFVLKVNKTFNLNYNKAHILYLIDKSNLNFIDSYGFNAFTSSITNNIEQNLELSIEDLNNLYIKCQNKQLISLINNNEWLKIKYNIFLEERNIFLEKQKLEKILNNKNTLTVLNNLKNKI